jgi:Protein of unknown function (DUF2695)
MRDAERDGTRSSLPVVPDEIRKLFNFVDERLSGADCDGSLGHTLTFLRQNHLPVDPVVTWLKSAGAHCDCEVLANAEEKFLFAFPEDEP